LYQLWREAFLYIHAYSLLICLELGNYYYIGNTTDPRITP
jgi:hypothetical protein